MKKKSTHVILFSLIQTSVFLMSSLGMAQVLSLDAKSIAIEDLYVSSATSGSGAYDKILRYNFEVVGSIYCSEVRSSLYIATLKWQVTFENQEKCKKVLDAVVRTGVTHFVFDREKVILVEKH